MLNRDHDISVLNSLITTTIDSAHGFEKSAEDVHCTCFEQLFRDFAAERRKVVDRDPVRRLVGRQQRPFITPGPPIGEPLSAM
jgi:uncharacterized protein (TIGR02284 family)